MYENGIDVVYDVPADDEHPLAGRSEHRKVTLPGWCAGDPQMAVALHFYGHRSWAEYVNVVDWQPHVDDAEYGPWNPDGTHIDADDDERDKRDRADQDAAYFEAGA